MSQDTRVRPERAERAASPSLPLEEIQRAVESVRYGVVQLIIQDGRIVQIDKTEKIRLI
jgi:hypothetical protein